MGNNVDWKKYFDSKAQEHGEDVKSSDYFDEKSFYIRRDSVLNWIGDVEGLEILDAGCGVGAFSEPLTKKNKVYGVDFSEEALNFAKKRGLECSCQDLTNLSFEKEKFDMILCIGVFQHLKSCDKIITELTRVLKPGGTLISETLNQDSVQRKIVMVGNTEKTIERMYKIEEISDVYDRLGYNDLQYLYMHHPFKFYLTNRRPNFLNKYFCTSFAVKGEKRKAE